mmetsp:Transcript_14496/g.41352  ORF Transcript_14496/g.41352 Transcript_14496/m.41352 type:complete len:336 (+) Transcript_14496:16-1023(+)
MGQKPCVGCVWSDDEDSESEANHAQEVRDIVQLLSERYGWNVDPEVEAALASTDLPSYRHLLKRRHSPEPQWDEEAHGAFRGDKRVRHLAAGGCVFEKLSVYVVLVQLLYPAIAKAGWAPRVLDVGCGTGFLTTVLARLVAPRGGKVIAIDMFSRQVVNAQKTMASCCPELLPHASFKCANGWDFRDPEGAGFSAIAVAAQATEVPQGLVQQLAPRGRLVLPLGSTNSMERGAGKAYRKYWLVEKGPDGTIQFNGRSGPIRVNFVPFLPSSNAEAQQPRSPAGQEAPAEPGAPEQPPPPPPQPELQVQRTVRSVASYEVRCRGAGSLPQRPAAAP